MQIRRFHCPELTPDLGEAVLPAGEAAHALRVLRLAPGDRLQLLNGHGLIAEAELLPPPNGARHPREARCRILSCRECPPPRPLTLVVAPPRGKAFDLVLRAATELGFTAVQPVLSLRGVARPEECSSNWQETILAAMKQSINAWPPQVLAPQAFDALLDATPPATMLFGALPRDGARPRPDAASIQSIWVGPEGGFAPEEEEALLAHGAIPATIGPAVLRVETAVPALAGYLAALSIS